MIRFVISPSQQPANVCKVCPSEENHCNLVGQAMYETFLKYEGIQPFLVPIELDLSGAIQFSNDKNGTYHLELHTDAGAYAKGASAFYVSAKGQEFITVAYDTMVRLTPTVDWVLKRRTDLGALNDTDAIAGLLEMCFHDNVTEARWLHENIKLIGYELATAYARHFNLQLKVVDNKKEKIDTIKRILDSL